MPPSRTQISKAVSHALRHEPWLYGLELDHEGWVELDDLAAALRQLGEAWSGIDEASVVRAVESSPKHRHLVEGGRIRALYGHSVPKRLVFVPEPPPARLFHGTSQGAVARILAGDGLRAMGRQYVHLATEPELALQVGRRKARAPELLVVDALAAHRAGTAFYRRSDVVWLADKVASSFISCQE